MALAFPYYLYLSSSFMTQSSRRENISLVPKHFMIAGKCENLEFPYISIAICREKGKFLKENLPAPLADPHTKNAHVLSQQIIDVTEFSQENGFL